MCTSFAVYNSKPLYGFNFDFPNVELKFHFETGAVGDIFYMSFEWGGRYPRVAGMNAAGLFSAAQMLVAPFEIHHRADETLISPYEVFSGSLNSGRSVDDVLQILGDRRLGYTTQRKGHQIYADRLGGVSILEPGPDSNLIYSSNEAFTVMTNSPAERERSRSVQNMSRLGIDRYQIARKAIQHKFDTFSIEDGFDVLRQTELFKGRFVTQCSMICDPEDGSIYLSIKRDREKIWKFNFRDRSVETYRGFNEFRKLPVGESGVEASKLVEFNEVDNPIN